jgi:hypothetical protein
MDESKDVVEKEKEE